MIRFVMEIEKCDYPQALRSLAERARISLPEADDEETRLRDEARRQLRAIYLEAARHYYRQLIGDSGADARAYLQRRGISTAIARRFGLGYAPDRFDSLRLHLQARGYTDDSLLMSSGLFGTAKNGKPFDLFRKRLMFPIFDVMNRIVAFGGRVLDDSLPKYVNSPETAIYTKGRHLYALNLAKKSAYGKLLVVEGYLDAISLHQAGLDFAVAALGTALTENQARLLRQYGGEDIAIAYDSDTAGQQAALRSLEILSRQGLTVKVVQIPDGKDPDDYVRRNGGGRLRELLNDALPLLDYRLLTLKRAHTADGRLDMLAYQQAAAAMLSEEENAIVREMYAKKLADELTVGAETVQREVERRHQRAAAPAVEARRPAAGPAPADRGKNAEAALTLLALLAVEPAIFPGLKPPPDERDFAEGPLRLLAGPALVRAAEGRLDPGFLIEHAGVEPLYGRPLRERVAQVLGSNRLAGTPDRRRQSARELGWLLRRDRLRQDKAELLSRLSEANTEEQRTVLQDALRAVSDLLTRKYKRRPDVDENPSDE